MAHDGQSLTSPLLGDLLGLTAAALPEIEALFEAARSEIRTRVTVNGKPSASALEEHQFAAHAMAWLGTYTEALRQMQDWALRINAEGAFGEMEALILQIAFGEYLSQIRGGMPCSRPPDGRGKHRCRPPEAGRVDAGCERGCNLRRLGP
jgi:(2S)-methylsuccinyl-CoA dehydrogenase